jgi:hypothetical protein
LSTICRLTSRGVLLVARWYRRVSIFRMQAPLRRGVRHRRSPGRVSTRRRARADPVTAARAAARRRDSSPRLARYEPARQGAPAGSV